MQHSIGSYIGSLTNQIASPVRSEKVNGYSDLNRYHFLLFFCCIPLCQVSDPSRHFFSFFFAKHGGTEGLGSMGTTLRVPESRTSKATEKRNRYWVSTYISRSETTLMALGDLSRRRRMGTWWANVEVGKPVQGLLDGQMAVRCLSAPAVSTQWGSGFQSEG